MAKSNVQSFYGIPFTPKSSFTKDVKGTPKAFAIGEGLSDDRAKWGLFKAAQTAGLPVKWEEVKAMKLTKRDVSGIMETLIPKADANRKAREAKSYDKALQTVLAKNPQMAAVMAMFK